MPPKPIKCQICSDQPFKYKCSTCQVVYCSVACYKKHKAETCTTLPAPASTAGNGPAADDAASAAPPDIPNPAFAPEAAAYDPSIEAETNRTAPALEEGEEPPLRALSSLIWPPEPEDADGEGDPLDRDQPKPLRRDELLAIATSVELRAFLANPLLPPLLLKINALPHTRSYGVHQTREQYLQMLLGVAPPASTGGAGNTRGRGARGRGRGARGGGRGGGAAHGAHGQAPEETLTPEDFRLFRRFALCVEDVLRSVGRERRGLNWELVDEDEEEDPLKMLL